MPYIPQVLYLILILKIDQGGLIQFTCCTSLKWINLKLMRQNTVWRGNIHPGLRPNVSMLRHSSKKEGKTQIGSRKSSLTPSLVPSRLQPGLWHTSWHFQPIRDRTYSMTWCIMACQLFHISSSWFQTDGCVGYIGSISKHLGTVHCVKHLKWLNLRRIAGQATSDQAAAQLFWPPVAWAAHKGCVGEELLQLAASKTRAGDTIE